MWGPKKNGDCDRISTGRHQYRIATRLARFKAFTRGAVILSKEDRIDPSNDWIESCKI
jgi:hypothetical protein